MSEKSTNLGLTLTNSSEGETTVYSWIDGMSGHGNSERSNMEIIDESIGNLKTSTNDHISNLQVHVVSSDKTVWNGKASIVRGYYLNNSFYEDSEHQSVISPSDKAIYYDIGNNMSSYLWDSSSNSYIASSQNTDSDYGTWE